MRCSRRRFAQNARGVEAATSDTTTVCGRRLRAHPRTNVPRFALESRPAPCRTPASRRPPCRRSSFSTRTRQASSSSDCSRTNGQIIAASQAYETKVAANNGIASVKKNAAGAAVERRDRAPPLRPRRPHPRKKAPARKAAAKKAPREEGPGQEGRPCQEGAPPKRRPHRPRRHPAKKAPARKVAAKKAPAKKAAPAKRAPAKKVAGEEGTGQASGQEGSREACGQEGLTETNHERPSPGRRVGASRTSSTASPVGHPDLDSAR